MDEWVERILDHVESTEYADLSPQAVAATRIFVLDSVGVGIAGSRVPFSAELLALAQGQWGGIDADQPGARRWSTGERISAPLAAMQNAYQIHNQEFDCVHEAAVVHPMAVILASLIAYIERSQHQTIGGQPLIVALNIAVDVATVLGQCAQAPMRFFRPGICGALGAVAGLCKLAQLNRTQTRHALGIMYSQCCGTMQAHLEGSSTLPMQVAFNARNAIMALDMAAAGLDGPADFLAGPFGFFNLIEDAGNAGAAFALLGTEWQMTRISHKPFPTGRAAHGGLDGIISLQSAHGFSADDIETVCIKAPPLVRRLVDRPARSDMGHNYAKLCMGYIAATWLLTGRVDLTDYQPEKLRDPMRLSLAARISMAPNASDDPNALAPQRVEIVLRDGRELAIDLPAVLGHPQRPFSRARQLEKFRRCCALASKPLAETHVQELVDAIDQLESLQDVRCLIDKICTPVTSGAITAPPVSA
ncbi:MmgE/PrpD family protein [uncultured Microbulbifer sp.]|uniref:MmgE/PrpD family protein n=1 Tax=uncultured Microbulbifer sp. TaxID=348147 RepID=UPI002612A57A|nr:MmgE/PrpD family protein [uncultured Microbulbifer sp.]